MLRVVVPGTLSNLGPGFDVLGMAVAVYNRFHFEAVGASGAYREGEPVVDPERHLVFRTLRAAEQAFGRVLPHGLSLVQEEQVPRSRGLGSSATARVAGLLAWVHFGGLRPPMGDLLAFLAEQEGHPDNAVAAMLGGVTFSDGGRPLTWRRLEPLACRVVLCVPDVQVSTQEARGVLPASYARGDVVYNLRRLAFLLHGLETGDASALRAGMGDRVHHPYRKGLIGPVDEALEAACAAGAATAFISGSGSTLAALVVDDAVDAAAVGEALAAPLLAANIGVRSVITRPAIRGAWEEHLERVG